MQPAMEDSVRCPRCRYELQGIAEEKGACPECGQLFSRQDIAAHRLVTISLALTMTTYGLIGAIVAGCLGAAAAFLPNTDPVPGGAGSLPTVRPLDVDLSARYVSAFPAIAAAWGIALLAGQTAKSAWWRRWSWAVAVAFTLALILMLSMRATLWGYTRPLGWLRAWRFLWPFNRAVSVTTYLLLITGAVVLTRFAARSNNWPAARMGRILVALTAINAAAAVAPWGVRRYMNSAKISQPFPTFGSVPTPPAGPSEWETWETWRLLLEGASSTFNWLAWIGLAFMAITLRALWQGGRKHP